MFPLASSRGNTEFFCSSLPVTSFMHRLFCQWMFQTDMAYLQSQKLWHKKPHDLWVSAKVVCCQGWPPAFPPSWLYQKEQQARKPVKRATWVISAKSSLLTAHSSNLSIDFSSIIFPLPDSFMLKIAKNVPVFCNWILTDISSKNKRAGYCLV